MLFDESEQDAIDAMNRRDRGETKAGGVRGYFAAAVLIAVCLIAIAAVLAGVKG